MSFVFDCAPQIKTDSKKAGIKQNVFEHVVLIKLCSYFLVRFDINLSSKMIIWLVNHM